jgi:hypothetical protein
MRNTDAVSHLTALWREWRHWLMNPNYVRNGNAVTWAGFESPMLPHEVSWELLAELEGKRQYSFQIVDGSLLRLLYNFDSDGRLIAGSLGYYAAIVAEAVPWIRIDYSPTMARGLVHTITHLHTSASTDMRVPMARLPTPKQFVELVCAWFYPQGYEQFRGVGPHGALAQMFGEEINQEVDPHFHKIVHVGVPTLR